MIKKIPEWKQFNLAVQKHITIESGVKKQIKLSTEKLKATFSKHGIHFKKLGEFNFGSVTDYDQEINLDVALIRYCNKNLKKETFLDFYKEIDRAFSDLQTNFKITKVTSNEYIKISISVDKTNINYYLQPIIKNENKDKNDKYFIFRNNQIQADLVVEVSEAFKFANRIANDNLKSLKKIIKFVLKDDFEFYYHLDMLFLRWFYEFMAKKIKKYLDQTTWNKKTQEFRNIDLKKIMSSTYLKKWYRKNVNFKELFTYILERLFQVNTYYFNNFNFKEDELFDSISRYSVFTNSFFSMPVDFFSAIKIFDLNNYDSQYELQSGLSEENGYSKVAFDASRNLEKRYVVTPIIRTGVTNIVGYQKALTKKSRELYEKLPNDLLKEIRSLKQREAMEALNQIAHDWLSVYKAKIVYVKPYFDAKYPLHKIENFEDLLITLMQTVDEISEEQFLVGFDN
ncbi:hypothetical protein SSABA_v1c05670 [Spiroplasma sabaudiense Ar-1343]|uniref:Uncharacterized protein n=1 Tax=Spiroplasma sabaudiense Ar-1343 TaxID=1276257 RepID=W6AAD6_9MOLU|nr:hypothetical protein [Spiroplasma sabaudiense]AHI53971.1 hypothetical protein SSABA_v1c05670 [Spiroplasma sabaudiense Ar-1343]